jgi:Tfp pilus assembly protein PilF
MSFPRQRVFLLSGCILAILALTARGLLSETTDAEQKELAIRGTVFLEAEHRPAQGVMVTVKSLSNEPSLTVLTDDSGKFEARGLASGSYVLFAEESGYESTRMTAHTGEAPAELRLYLRTRPAAPAGGAKGSVSVHELKIPGKAQEAYRKGMGCLANDDATGSVAHFQKAISMFPEFYEAYYSLGVAQMKLHHSNEAIDAYQRCIDLSRGQCPLGEFAVGVVLQENHRLTEAETVLRRALEHDANYAKGYLYLSVVLYELNRLDEAELNAREVERCNPDLAPVYLVLANIHARRGNEQEEFRALEKYLQLNPRGVQNDAGQAYEKLQKKLAQKQAMQEQ